MDITMLTWINTLFLIFAAIVQGIVLYSITREIRKSSEALSRIEETAARNERISLAVLERVAPPAGRA